MNVEKLQCLIAEIENEKLRDYSLKCLKNECKLNFLNTPSFLIEKATQRLENKIKACQKIEKDLPNYLIGHGDSFFLTGKLDTLRLNLVILYANEIIEDDYNEIKTFIFKILNFHNINLKSKFIDLTIKLLEKTTESFQFNKDLIVVLDLLKLLINDPHAFKIEHLQNINNLPEKDIRKDFYEIVYELNKKVAFLDLLNQLSMIIRSCDKSLLMQFNLKFINNSIKDQTMDVDDFIQLITLVFQSLKCYESVSKNGFSSIRNKILNQKNLADSLLEFEKDFNERIPIIKLELEMPLPNLPTEKSHESDINIYFPTLIKNEKLKVKFEETKYEILKENKNIESNVHFSLNLRKRFGELSSKASSSKIKNVIGLAVNVTENLKDIAETSTERIKKFINKTENIHQKTSEEIAENDVDIKGPLIKAKTELSSIKEKLDTWKSKLNYLIVQSDRIDTLSIDLNQNPEFLVNSFRFNIDEKFRELIRRTLEEFENINAMSKSKGCWLAKLESNNTPSFYKKILIRGYFNIDFSIKKINAKLGDAPSFNEITDFISKQSFWRLLFTFGIVCWPWIDKRAFAHSWAEQLYLPKIINEIEKLKTVDSKEDFLEKVIILSKGFFLYKNETIVQILKDFKSYIVIMFERLESINQKIEESLNESNDVPPLSTPINRLSCKISSEPKDNLIIGSAITLSAG